MNGTLSKIIPSFLFILPAVVAGDVSLESVSAFNWGYKKFSVEDKEFSSLEIEKPFSEDVEKTFQLKYEEDSRLKSIENLSASPAIDGHLKWTENCFKYSEIIKYSQETITLLSKISDFISLPTQSISSTITDLLPFLDRLPDKKQDFINHEISAIEDQIMSLKNDLNILQRQKKYYFDSCILNNVDSFSYSYKGYINCARMIKSIMIEIKKLTHDRDVCKESNVENKDDHKINVWEEKEKNQFLDNVYAFKQAVLILEKIVEQHKARAHRQEKLVQIIESEDLSQSDLMIKDCLSKFESLEELNFTYLDRYNKKNKTIFHLISLRKTSKLVLKLIIEMAKEKGDLGKVNFNIADDDGQTPLHVAASHLNSFAVKYLLWRGVNPLEETANNVTPLELALGGLKKAYEEENEKDMASAYKIIRKMIGYCQQKDEEAIRYSMSVPVVATYTPKGLKVIQSLIAKISTPFQGKYEIYLFNLQDDLSHYLSKKDQEYQDRLETYKTALLEKRNQEKENYKFLVESCRELQKFAQYKM